MAICKKCIIPDSFPEITFKDGICNICRNHNHSNKDNKNYLGKEKLIEILTSKKNREYDCTVPFSGGKDSSYALYYIARELKLKPLAIFFDNGFTTEYAMNNIRNICQNLNVELIIGNATKFRKKIIKESLLLSKYTGQMLPVCSNCESNLRSFAINETVKRDIPFIIWGSTDFEDAPISFIDSQGSTFRESYGSIASMLHKLKKSLELFLLNVSFSNKIKTSVHGAKYLYYLIRDNMEMNVPEGWKKFNPFMEVSFEGKKTKAIYFYDYIYYDPFNFIKILEKEIGWQSPKGKEGKMDCQLALWHDYEQLLKTGLSATGFTLSVLVRDGLLDREKALEKEELIKRDLKIECKKLGEELGVNIMNVLQ